MSGTEAEASHVATTSASASHTTHDDHSHDIVTACDVDTRVDASTADDESSLTDDEAEDQEASRGRVVRANWKATLDASDATEPAKTVKGDEHPNSVVDGALDEMATESSLTDDDDDDDDDDVDVDDDDGTTAAVEQAVVVVTSGGSVDEEDPRVDAAQDEASDKVESEGQVVAGDSVPNAGSSASDVADSGANSESSAHGAADDESDVEPRTQGGTPCDDEGAGADPAPPEADVASVQAAATPIPLPPGPPPPVPAASAQIPPSPPPLRAASATSSEGDAAEALPTELLDYGHVFVVLGDLRKLSCDAWLASCGSNFRVARHWLDPALPDHVLAEISFMNSSKGMVPGCARVRRVQGIPDDLPLMFLGNVVLYGRMAALRAYRPMLKEIDPEAGKRVGDMSWLLEGIAHFFKAAALALKDKAPRNRRACHLIGVPLVGTGGGGARGLTGRIIMTLMPFLRSLAAKYGFDVAVVTPERVMYTALQSYRRREGTRAWNCLPPRLKPQALRLAEKAKKGKLAIFIGAGVSMAAGLPSWGGLLSQLADDAGLSVHEKEDLQQLGFLDQAKYLELRFGSSLALNTKLISILEERTPLYSMAHVLLANLPVDNFVTTNYDCRFELACKQTCNLSVMPYNLRPEAPRWLLKMHGCTSRPSSIVLSRRSYIRYDHTRSALAGIVQSLLLTKTMLFCGFSLADDNFERILDAVLAALDQTPPEAIGDNLEGPLNRPLKHVSKKLGTALFLIGNPMMEALHGRNVDLVSMVEQPDAASARSAQDQDAVPCPADDAEAESSPPPRWHPSGTDYACAARRIEIFLDFLGHKASSKAQTACLLDDMMDDMLSPDDREFKKYLQRMLREVPRQARQSSAFLELINMVNDAFHSHSTNR